MYLQQVSWRSDDSDHEWLALQRRSHEVMSDAVQPKELDLCEVEEALASEQAHVGQLVSWAQHAM